MHGTESIGNENLGHVGKSFGEICAVLLLTDVKAQILKKHDLAGLKRGGLGLCIFPDDVLGKDYFLSEKLGEALGNRSQCELGLPLALGLSKMGAGNDSCTVLEQITDRRERCNNALVAGDLTGFLVLGDVEVAAEQDFFPVDVYVIDGLLVVIHFLTS